MTHLTMERVPSKYILKRYTRDAATDAGFNRHDKMFVGPDGDTKKHRATAILGDLFRL